MTVHILFDNVDGNLIGVYSDINILYDAVRNFMKRMELGEDRINEFNELLAFKGTNEALEDVDMYALTMTLDADYREHNL